MSASSSLSQKLCDYNNGIYIINPHHKIMFIKFKIFRNHCNLTRRVMVIKKSSMGPIFSGSSRSPFPLLLPNTVNTALIQFWSVGRASTSATEHLMYQDLDSGKTCCQPSASNTCHASIFRQSSKAFLFVYCSGRWSRHTVSAL